MCAPRAKAPGHPAQPPRPAVLVASFAVFPPALLVPLIPPTPLFVSPLSSIETPHDSERWSLVCGYSWDVARSPTDRRHLREPSRTRPPPPMSVAPASLQHVLPHPRRSRPRLHAHITSSRSTPPSVDLRPCPRPELNPGRRVRLSDAHLNGRRTLMDRRTPDGYATPGPPSRPPRRPAVFRAPRCIC
jgi:hypothetical protein